MKNILILIIALASFFNANASHFMGGEITWVCIKDASNPDVGKYVFTLKVYQDCDGINFSFNTQTLTVHDNALLPNILLNFSDTNDISASGVSGSIPCYDCGNQPTGQVGAIMEWIYISDPIVVPGTPPANGWHFTWGSCCRTGAITNIVSPVNANWTLRAVMYPYTDISGTVFPNGNICHDSSPIFKEQAKSILCTGYPFSYSHLAFDVELDSLSYSWAEPLDNSFAYDPTNPSATALAFVPPYSFNSPIPGNPTLNSVNGEISFNSNISGFFVTTVKVAAFKCDQIVAEVFREVQVALMSCGNLPNGQPNSPPVITPPVGTQVWVTTLNPSTGLPSYETTINAGETIDFSITASDADININNVLQTITLAVEGGQLDANYSLGGLAVFNVTASSPGNVSGDFNWVTDCAHTAASLDSNCQRTTNLFTFNLKAYDDFCPANGTVIATISIYVEPQITQPAPEFKCVTKNSSGEINVTWDHRSDANASTVYFIHGADNIGGPYTIVGTETFPVNSFTSSNVPISTNYYYMTLESLCADMSVNSDTIMPIQFDITSTNVSCWDDSDGKIVVDMQTNNIVPFTYILDSVPNILPYPGDSVFSGLSTGTYTLTITDSVSCYIDEVIHITAPGSPLQVITVGTPVVCHQDSTSFSVVQAVGGTGPFSYSWYNFSSISGAISVNDTAFGLSAGVYFVEVTDDNGCDTVGSVHILSPNTALFSTTQIGEVVCKGDASGYLVGDAGGGFAPYTYEWSTSVGGIIQSTFGSYNTDTLVNVSAGIYLLDITDHFGCTVSQSSLTVNEPSQTLVLDTIYLIDSIACFGDNDGRALGVKSGGDPSYVYTWDNGESSLFAEHLTSGYHTLSVVDDRGCEVIDSIYIPESSEIISTLVIEESISCYGSTNGVVSVSTIGGYPLYIYSWSNNQPLDTAIVDTAFDLSYGVYALTTEDSLGCSVVDSIYLSEPGLLTMEAHELEWVSCYGLVDGLASASAQGGTLPYTFVWDNNQLGDTVNTLSEGLHTVVVTDARGCTATDAVTIHEPTVLTVSINVLNSVYCNGMSTGSLEANALGGTPFVGTSSAYTYLWDDALQASQTTAVAVNLAAAIYTIKVTDFRGCTATDTVDITSVTNTLVVSATSSNVSCYGSVDGSASVVALGGHAPYAYHWVGPNGSALSTLDIISGLSAGTYSVSVSDTNNCIRNTSVDIIEPSSIIYNVSSVLNETCDGACNGQIYLDYLSGGTLPYVALLTNNTTGLVTQHAVQSDSIFLVCSGDYTVVLTDTNECSSTVLSGGNSQAVVNAYIALPIPVVSLINDVDCYGDSTAELIVSSADTNYSYTWEDVLNPGIELSSGDTVAGLVAGSYVVFTQYTDSLGQVVAGCNVSSAAYTIVEGDDIIITETLHIDVLCNGDNTGSISVQVQGGTSSYNYVWNPNQPTNATITNLLAGTYTLTITDGNSCEQEAVFVILEPQVLTANITQNGYVLTASVPMGGIAPYSYSWREQGQSTVHLQGGTNYNVYAIGTYYVLVTDANGCMVESNSILFNDSWDCIVGACVDPGNGTGLYASLSSCESACLETGVDQVSSEIILSIYPNPFKNETTVDFGREIKQATISVVDVFGKLIEQHSITNTNKYTLKRANKAAGIYFVEIEVEGIVIKEKLIIE